MTFLAPLLTALTVLCAVPLVIWLLNRSRYKVVRWPALEFLLKTMQRSSQRVQVRELILLILRTLAVILVALALARPSLAFSGLNMLGQGGGVSAVIVLDCSLSMAVREGTTTRFEMAKVRAQELVAKLPTGSSAALIRLSDVINEEIAEPTPDLAYVAQMIASAEQSDGGTNVVAGLARAVDMLRKVSGRREIYLVSDMQARGWPSADDQALNNLASELANTGAPAVILADVGGSSLRNNIQVERMSSDDVLVTADVATSFTALIRNRGEAPASNVQVELWVDAVDGQMRKAASTVVDRIETVSEVRLEARLTSGLHRVQVRTTPDALPADDVRQIVVDVVDKIRVLVVDGSDVARGSAFIKAALSPIAALSSPVASPYAEDVGGAAEVFHVDVVGAAALGQIDMSAYQVVVLNDLGASPVGFGQSLQSWLAAGKGLILLPGTRASAVTWNQELALIAPAALEGDPRELVDDKGIKGQILSTAELLHPVVAYFSSPSTQPFLAQPRFWKAHALVPYSGSTVVARFADGHPALVERTSGCGSVLMTAFPSDKAWSDLPLRPAFLMLVRRMVQHAALGNRPILNVRVNEPITCLVPPRFVGARVEAIDPHGKGTVLNPEPKSDGSNRFTSTDTPFAGFYSMVGGERPWSFAANPPAEESDGASLTQVDIMSRLPGATSTWVKEHDDAQALLQRARSGWEIWWLFFAIGVGCLIVESVLVVLWAPKGT